MTATTTISRRPHHSGGPVTPPPDTNPDTENSDSNRAITVMTSNYKLVPPRRGAGRVGPEPALVPARPDLERFRENLVRGMIKKNMTASDVARKMWGEKKNSQGNTVAKGRDRMTHYLSGSTYPNAENVAKLAEILDLTLEDLAVDTSKSNLPRPPVAPTPRVFIAHGAKDEATVQALLNFQMLTPGYVDILFQQRVPQAKAFEWLEFTRKLLLDDNPPDSDAP